MNYTYNIKGAITGINNFYTYTATGLKLKTIVYEGTQLISTTEYSGAYVYVAGSISFTNIPGGRIVAKNNEYQYNLTDHLGNVRVTFKKNDATFTAEIIQEDHYYPFGMRMNGQSFSNTDLLNKFLYNGKELQEQTNYIDYGFRQMDPQLGRWHVIDALSEKYMSISGYAYTLNDPINHTDLMGLLPNTTFNWWGGSASIPGFDGGSMFKNTHSGASHQDFGPSFEDFFTEIEGTWLDNDDIINVDIMDVLTFAIEGGMGGDLFLTFVAVGDKTIPVLSVGELGGVEIEDGSLWTYNTTAGQFIGNVNAGNFTYKYEGINKAAVMIGLGHTSKETLLRYGMKGADWGKAGANYLKGMRGLTWGIGSVNMININKQYTNDKINTTKMISEQIANSFITLAPAYLAIPALIGWELGRAISNTETWQHFKFDAWESIYSLKHGAPSSSNIMQWNYFYNTYRP